MAKFKLITKLPKIFQDLKGLTAVAINQDGEELKSLDVTKRKLKFRLKKEEILLDQEQADITIKIIDENGDAVNFSKDGKTFDLDSDEQEFTRTVSNKRKRAQHLIRLQGSEVVPLDITAPVFEEGEPEALEENSGVGATVYQAVANDDSGKAVTYSLAGDDSGSFSIDTSTGVITINENADFETKSRYDFDVIATDPSGNSTIKPLRVKIADVKDTGDTIELSNERDFYSSNTGKIFDNNNNLLTESDKRLSQFDDTINASAGQFGQGESLQDPSQDDNDVLTIKTNLGNKAEDALDPNNNHTVKNIESLVIDATADESTTLNLEGFENLNSLTVKGLFDGDISVTNYLDAKVSDFNFSGSTSFDAGFILDPQNNNDPLFAKPLNITGSAGGDQFSSLFEGLTCHAGDGNDTVVGSLSSPDYIAGENGIDEIALFEEAQSQDTVSLKGVTDDLDADIITGFLGFNNAENTNGKRHDLLEFDAETFTNFSANSEVEEVDVDDLVAAFLRGEENPSKNKFIVDTDNDITNSDLGIIGGKDLLALANDTGNLYYSRNGNFDTNGVVIATIDDFANFAANENVSII